MMDSNELENKFQKCLDDFFNKVYRQWYIYNYLFSSKENVNILNRYENKVIMTLFQNSVSDSIILGIQRLLDETEYDKKENLTLHYFKQKLLNTTQKKIFGNKIKSIEIKFEKYKEYRHNKLGHYDSEYNKDILIDKDIEVIINDIVKILNDYINNLNLKNIKNIEIGDIIFICNNVPKCGRKIVKDYISDIKILEKNSSIC